jgi:hypothetical protein
MYRRLDKDFVGSVSNFIPYLLLFLLFSINFIFKQKSVNDNFFFNITCCLVFSMLLFTIFRTLTDKNMIVMIRLGYDINFNYFADMIAPMRMMLYVLCASDICLIISGMDLGKIFGIQEELETKTQVETKQEEKPKSKPKTTTKTIQKKSKTK